MPLIAPAAGEVMWAALEEGQLESLTTLFPVTERLVV
jgi:hypothetical protein